MAARLLAGDEFDDLLTRRVRPADWRNPDPAPRYNLVVVGAGPAGLVCASAAAGLGARVALVERGLMGGDCLNVGCVPSKTLLHAARAAADARRAGEWGVNVSKVDIDFAAVMRRVRSVRAGLSGVDSVERFTSLGVDVFLGEGRFTGPDTVQVGSATLRFGKAVIATGSRTAVPDIPGLADSGFLTNETIFSLTELPARLAVLGAGPVGCELGQAFARLGSRVTLIGNGERVLPREEPEASAAVAEALHRDGVQILLGANTERVERHASETVMVLADAQEVVADAVLVAAGRRPNVESLNLEAARVRYDPGAGVQVNDHLRTTNHRVYAAGDVCSPLKYTHAADAMARIVVRNALFRGSARVSRLTVPRCTYTTPEVAHTGATADELRSKRVRFRTLTQSLSHVDRAVIEGEQGFVSAHLRAGTDQILGATLVARHAGEMINTLTLAIDRRVGLRALANVVHPYPTVAEAVRKLADAANRERLTPWAKWALGLLARWNG